MKFFTKNLNRFLFITLLLTIVFRYGLSAILASELFSYVALVAIAYGVSVFITGWVFGKKDNLHLPIYDIGFRFHLVTYAVANGVAIVWYSFGLQSKYEHIDTVYYTALFWGAGLLLHFIFFLITRRNAIKGLSKDDIFE